MSNIEEDIEILEEFIKLDRNIRDNKKESDYEKFCERRCIAIENILAERKQDKERIKELEVLEDDLKDKRIVYVDTPEFAEKFIQVKKIKDIFQKNRNELFSVTYLDYKQYKPFTMQIDRINKIEKELLEDE